MCEKEKKNVQKATDDFVLRQPLPPQINELLLKKGWSWPLSEKNKRQIRQAFERLDGSLTVPEELQAEVYEGIRGFENYARRTKNVP